MDYGFTHEGKVFTPNGTTGLDAATSADRNKAIEQAELARWAECPDRMLAYYKLVADDQPLAFGRPKLYRSAFRTHGTVTTWLGTQIGTVTEARVYPHNFGGRFVSVRVKATNGAEYYGRASYDWGQCVVLRKARKASR